MQNPNHRYQNRTRKTRQQQKLLIYGLLALVLIVALVFGLRAILYRGAPDQTVLEGEKAAESTLAPTDQPSEAEEQPVRTLAPTAAASNEKVKLLPIIARKKNETKKIAITVDDCLNADVLAGIVKLAEKYKIGLTFFPRGNTFKKNADLWKEIYEKGFEIENHTYTHTNVSKLKGDKLRDNIKKSNDALNEVLGVNYHMRSFRCPTGDGMKLPRLHTVLRELGYESVASWGLSGTRKAEETIRITQGGQILLFHANKKSDLAALKKVVPGLINRGFELVTINELYGKGANEVTELGAN